MESNTKSSSGVPAEVQTTISFNQILHETRSTFDSGITLSLEFRMEQLRNLREMFTDCEAQILSALFKDLRKPSYEGKLGEIKSVLWEIDGMLKNLKRYAADEKLPFNLLAMADRPYVRKEPYGVALIIGPWNFPFMLCCQPLVGAIAAGNCAIVKPSEVAPTCAETIARLMGVYLDQRCYRVILGDGEVTKSLLKEKFDYIFFTGSPANGRFVLQAAALHLTPATLELGGKNPCYVDKSTNLKRAVKRIIWGKTINGGQMCVCPDYILCPQEMTDEFVQLAKMYMKQWYGENMQEYPDLARIVNKQHFNRLKKLLETTGGTIAVGGNTDEEDLWVEPTVVVNVDPEKDVLMKEEVFGPILSIVPVASVDDAIRIIRSKPKPLALYIFCEDKAVTRKLIESTSSGNTCVNDVVWQSVWVGLPFGGVGESGMGSYHGKYTFDTFSHKRSIVECSLKYFKEKTFEPRYSPHSNWKLKYFWLNIGIFEDFYISLKDAVIHVLVFMFVYHVVLPIIFN